jgi:ATP-dependent Clp protease ATP-binding subunit ClpA
MGRIFISYRRQDSAEVTGRIYDHLVHRFGGENVFKDVDSIDYGTDFRRAMSEAICSSSIVLVVIGDQWVNVTDERGRRRLDNLHDFVRMEIEASLKRDVRIVPLLVRGAAMPLEMELPESLRALAYRHAISIRNDPDFHRDMNRLMDSIAEYFDKVNPALREPMAVTSTQSSVAESTPDVAPEVTKVSEVSMSERLMRSSIQEIEQQLERRLFSQPEAVQRVLSSIKLIRMRFYRDRGPAATFLFLGPSGLGKSELARELARIMCGDEEKLIWFEMVRYRDANSLVGLVGAPPGYVGYGEGKLTNALRDFPESVLFFDEIDKAGELAINLFYRLTDSGVVQDAAGPKRDGRRAVVILSMNVDCRSTTSLDADPEEIRRSMMESAMTALPRDLVSRIENVVCFFPLSVSACRRLTDQAVERLSLKLRDRGIIVSVDDSAREIVNAEFYQQSQLQGARAIDRVIDGLLMVAIIDFISAEGILLDGSSSVGLAVTATDRRLNVQMEPQDPSKSLRSSPDSDS